MRKKPGTKQSHGEKVVKDIRRATRKQYSAEEKIRIVLDACQNRCTENTHRWFFRLRAHLFFLKWITIKTCNMVTLNATSVATR